MDPRYSQYLQQHHIQDLWDGFVAAYIKQHGNRTDVQQTVEGGINKEAVSALKAYLQSASQKNTDRKENNRYIIVLDDGPSANSADASRAAALRYAQHLCEAEIARTYLSQPWLLAPQSQELHTDADIEQRKMEKARLNAIQSIRTSFNNLPPSKKSVTVLLASSWPRSIADVVLLEREIGDPLSVTLFESASSPPVNDETEEAFDSADQETREAGGVNPRRERAALLDYCDAKGYLTRVKVGEASDNCEGLIKEQADLLKSALAN